MNIYQKKNQLNAYQEFILVLIKKQNRLNYKELYKNKLRRKNLELQVHHICPKHAGGKDQNSNKVICTVYDHIQAHKIRFETYHNNYDKAAYLLMGSQDKKGRQALSLAIVEKNKRNSSGFFNPETQKDLANRPKKKYHLKENPKLATVYAKKSKGVPKSISEKQRFTLKKRGENLGKTFGSKGGIKHQHPLTKKRLSGTLLWKHISGVEVETSNIKTLANVKDRLNLAVQNSVTHTSGLSELLRYKSKKRYGWFLIEKTNVKKEISSEAE